MTEVLTYSTKEQADKDLSKFFDRNNEVIGELERIFGELSEVSKWKEVGEEYEVDCVLQMHKVAGKYTYSGWVLHKSEYIPVKHLSNLEELVKEIKKQFSVKGGGVLFGRRPYELYGVNVNPLFYTVEKEHFNFGESEEEIEGMKKYYKNSINECKTEAGKECWNDFLKVVEQPDVYKIEGLTPEEIAEFVRLYDVN